MPAGSQPLRGEKYINLHGLTGRRLFRDFLCDGIWNGVGLGGVDAISLQPGLLYPGWPGSALTPGILLANLPHQWFRTG